MNKNMMQILNHIQTALQGTGYEVYQESDNSVAVGIVWGDWKHDHIYADCTVAEVTPYKSRSVTVTEEDGSDCYSAIHIYEY